MNISPEQKTRLNYGLKIVLVAFLIAVAFNFLTDFRHGGYGDKPENTISFSGYGEVTAVPDIANVYFTITKESKTVKEAQILVAEVENKSLQFLRENNVLDKDIKTSNASFYPKYDYKYDTQVIYPCTEYSCPPRPGQNVIVGYEASESITVKVRNTDDVGKIMEGLGALGVSNLSGPNFSIDDEEGLKAEARKKAIENAKTKAKVLARDLGVRLDNIVSFSESGDYYPTPMYAKSAMESDASGSPSAEIPKGENIISSNVTITYRIK